MKPRLILTTLSLALATLAAGPLEAAEAAKSSPEEVIRQMSAKLGGAKTLSFKAKRETDAILVAGRTTREKANVSVLVERPNKFAAQSAADGDVRHFYFDGRNLTVLDVTHNHYSTVAARTTLDGLEGEVGAKYGLALPMAEFALSDVGEDMAYKAQTVTDLGNKYLPAGFLGMSGVECRRLLLAGKLTDAELWIATSDGLPRKLIVTHKHASAGAAKSTVEFSDWNLAAKATPADFTFVAPKGAVPVHMVTVKELAAHRKTKAKK